MAALALAITMMTAASAHAEVTMKTGYLTCHEAGGWGYIIGSSHKLHCTYSSTKGRTEYYTGSISKFGADIGFLNLGGHDYQLNPLSSVTELPRSRTLVVRFKLDF